MKEDEYLDSFESYGDRAVRTANLSAISNLDLSLTRSREILMSSKTFSESAVKKRLSLSSKVVNLSENTDNRYRFEGLSTNNENLNGTALQKSEICDLKQAVLTLQDKLRKAERELIVELEMKEFNAKAFKTTEDELNQKIEELYTVNCKLKSIITDKDKKFENLDRKFNEFLRQKDDLYIDCQKKDYVIKDIESRFKEDIGELVEKIRILEKNNGKFELENELRLAKDYIEKQRLEYSAYFDKLNTELERVKQSYIDLSKENSSSHFYQSEMQKLSHKNQELEDSIKNFEYKLLNTKQFEDRPRHEYTQSISDLALEFSSDLNKSSLLRKEIESKVLDASHNFSGLKSLIRNTRTKTLSNKLVDDSLVSLIKESRNQLKIDKDFPDLDTVGLGITNTKLKFKKNLKKTSKIYRSASYNPRKT